MDFSPRSNGSLTAILCLGGLCLMFAPAELVRPIRNTVRDSAGIGAKVIRAGGTTLQQVVANLRANPASQAELDRLRNEHRRDELRIRQLELERALLRDRVKQGDQGGATPEIESEPLLLPELVTARIIGLETAAIWKGHKILDQGAAKDVAPELLVLESEATVVDQGADESVGEGDVVYAGRTVIGRIAEAGRWTSTLQPITDAKFRGAAQIYRQGHAGWLPGPRGNLKGDGGPNCQLEWIATTEPVEVGDHVFTAETDGVVPFPMYYGKVVSVTGAADSPHWEIRVEPAANLSAVREVQVFRTRLNPLRVLAN
jgi:cell shape-determining protein MreC